MGKESEIKCTGNILNKFIEENSPNKRKEISIKVQEAYRTQNGSKINSHITL